jgi:SAM-dependent methyltransferase
MAVAVTLPPCFFCGDSAREIVWTYDAAPVGETRFPLPEGAAYARQIMRCDGCGHFQSLTDMDLSGLYSEAYVNATYADSAGMRAQFERITSLPPERSDNRARVRRVTDFAARALPADLPRTLLDVGSGLAVFPWAMAREGWDVTAVDPDPRAVEHARQVAGVAAVCGDFFTLALPRSHGVVTLNKVLEHVADPVAMLVHTLPVLAAGGIVYVEVPDGEAARADGFGREEFFVEHLHVFSSRSLDELASRAGLDVLRAEQLREPSGKYTLAAFLRSREAA